MRPQKSNNLKILKQKARILDRLLDLMQFNDVTFTSEGEEFILGHGTEGNHYHIGRWTNKPIIEQLDDYLYEIQEKYE